MLRVYLNNGVHVDLEVSGEDRDEAVRLMAEACEGASIRGTTAEGVYVAVPASSILYLALDP